MLERNKDTSQLRQEISKVTGELETLKQFVYKDDKRFGPIPTERIPEESLASHSLEVSNEYSTELQFHRVPESVESGQLLIAEGNGRVIFKDNPSSPLGHTHDHGTLTGLGDNDHPQYQLVMDRTTYDIHDDFTSLYQQGSWVGYVYNSGSIATVDGIASHPGIVALKSSASNNSGYAFFTSFNAILLEGSEEFEGIIYIARTASTKHEIGYMNALPWGSVTHGAWVKIDGTTLTGETQDGVGNASTTGSSYTAADGVWYRVKIEVNSGASQVDFHVYSMAGVELWADNLATDIPTSAVGVGVASTSDDVGAAVQTLSYMDYIGFSSSKTLTR